MPRMTRQSLLSALWVAAAIALVSLTLLAAATAVTSVRNADQARRNEAALVATNASLEQQTRVALSRQLAATSLNNIDSHYDSALLEAVEFDLELAGAELLGRDVARICPPPTLELARAWLSSPRFLDPAGNRQPIAEPGAK